MQTSTGDNLEVLKLLQKSYVGKIKVIYIDPPYNTGNDFIYNDNFTQPLDEYLKLSKQIDEEGSPLVANVRADGRFHAKWLSMMLPRLQLARNLLREDGLIFVSIDDIEVANLREIMNEVFGEENFEALVNWRRRHNQPNDKSKMIGKVSEHVLVYSRNSAKLKEKGTYYGVPISKDRISDYTNPDNDSKGEWTSNPWKAAVGRGGSTYQIITPAGKRYTETWYGNADTFEQYKKEGRVHWTDEGRGLPRVKIYLTESLKEGQPAINFLKHEDYGTNQEGSAELEDIMGESGLFDNPKPSKLLKALIRVASRGNDIVLDFFAGTGTTAQAVLELNSEDKQQRSFITCQLPEVTQNTKWKTIAEIGKERIRRVITRAVKDKKGQNIGFRVWKLTQSNFKEWSDYKGVDINELVSLFTEQENTLVDKWKEDGLLAEVMLQEGFPLTSLKDKISSVKDNNVWKISSCYCEHSLYICLDKSIKHKTIETLALSGKDIFICLDNAVTDEDKVKLSDKGLIKTI